VVDAFAVQRGQVVGDLLGWPAKEGPVVVDRLVGDFGLRFRSNRIPTASKPVTMPL
jgi:hypothetical protein